MISLLKRSNEGGQVGEQYVNMIRRLEDEIVVLGTKTSKAGKHTRL